MKFLLSLIFTLLSIYNVQAQKSTTDEPLADSNVIYVSYTGTDEDAFRAAGKALIIQGYKLDRSDHTFYTILTRFDQREGYDFDFELNVAVLDGKVIIRGDARNSGHKFKPYYGKGKGILVPVVAFNFMYKYANRLKSIIPESTVSFGME